MSKVGDALRYPESGWKRFEDNNKDITYLGNLYNYDINEHAFIGKNSFIKFNFTGNKIRIICEFGLNGNYGTANIKIDNEINENFTTDYNYTGGTVGIAYENKNLDNKEHTVIITTTSDVYFIFDSIDIDASAELKKYNARLFKYIIKQNNQYYTLKSNFYHEDTLDDNLIKLTDFNNIKEKGIFNLTNICINKLDIDESYNLIKSER